MPNDNPTVPPPGSQVSETPFQSFQVVSDVFGRFMGHFADCVRRKDVKGMREDVVFIQYAAAVLDEFTQTRERLWASEAATQTQTTKGNT